MTSWLSRYSMLSLLAVAFCFASQTSSAEELPLVTDVELQPLAAGAHRVAQALELVGTPLSQEQLKALEEASKAKTDQAGAAAIQRVLDPLCLAGVNINPESRVKVARGAAPAKLIQQGWRSFLIKVHNEAGVTAPLGITSPQAPELRRATNKPEPPATIDSDLRDQWLAIELFHKQPLQAKLSGLEVEYCLVSLFSRDSGKREGKLQFDVGQGTQDLGFRNELNVLFQCEPAVDVVFDVLDDDGSPTTGQFVIRDTLGRVYPSRARRVPPDFFFHDQIYRASGETVSLPPGTYEFEWSRGPEYYIDRRTVEVSGQAKKQKESFRLRRWIKLADLGWYSGDHHVHGAGCAHYDSPSQGVQPEDMMRHILGEDLNVGCVLTWGPCWYYQKQFFSGQVHSLSNPNYLMRYDVEVSGFPSSHAGHLCLLRLTEDDYPGTTRIEQWPSWDLPVLQWGKKQGGVVGFSHSGWGLKVDATSLPTYEMPAFDGIGANEYIVDVVHDTCDFISAVDTPSIWELNIWYHTLNCGFECRISGETDFPCIYGERVGLGRVYVKLPPGEPLDYDRWVLGIRDGRTYCSDGLSHLYDYHVNGLGVGEPGHDGRASVLRVDSGQPLKIQTKAAAMLAEKPREDIRSRRLDEKPYWHVERARVGNTRKVPVELIVNGEAVERREIAADGSIHDVQFDYTPDRSSWVALRVFPSSHTNPVFVEVDGKPIRANKKSAQWCIDAVDVCWKSKEGRIREEERLAAKQAFDHASEVYRQILKESHE